MSVSEAVRRAMKKGKLSQTELGRRWGTSPQVINNKLRQYGWNGDELAEIAAFTGGKLAFVYPDGEQIDFDNPVGETRPEKKARTKKAAAPAKGKETKAPAKAKQKPAKTEAPAEMKPEKPAKPEKPEQTVEQKPVEAKTPVEKKPVKVKAPAVEKEKAPAKPKKQQAPAAKGEQISIFDMMMDV